MQYMSEVKHSFMPKQIKREIKKKRQGVKG
jgi:hypothetical protein